MPDVYRAPEVILNMSWDYKVNIWNVGMVVGKSVETTYQSYLDANSNSRSGTCLNKATSSEPETPKAD